LVFLDRYGVRETPGHEYLRGRIELNGDGGAERGGRPGGGPAAGIYFDSGSPRMSSTDRRISGNAAGASDWPRRNSSMRPHSSPRGSRWHNTRSWFTSMTQYSTTPQRA